MTTIRFTGVLVLLLLFLAAVAYANGGGWGHRSYGYPQGRHYGYAYLPYGWYGAGGGTYGTSGTYGYGGPPRTSSRYSSGRYVSSDGDGRYVHRPPSEECLKFLGKTADLRKDFERKRDDYWALREDKKARPAELAVQQEEVRALWRNIQAQNLQNCHWQN